MAKPAQGQGVRKGKKNVAQKKAIVGNTIALVKPKSTLKGDPKLDSR